MDTEVVVVVVVAVVAAARSRWKVQVVRVQI